MEVNSFQVRPESPTPEENGSYLISIELTSVEPGDVEQFEPIYLKGPISVENIEDEKELGDGEYSAGKYYYSDNGSGLVILYDDKDDDGNAEISEMHPQGTTLYYTKSAIAKELITALDKHLKENVGGRRRRQTRKRTTRRKKTSRRRQTRARRVRK